MDGEWLIQPDNIIYNIRVSHCLTVQWDGMTRQLRRVDVMCVMYMSSSRIFPLSRYSICDKLEKQKFLPSCLVFVHSWHLFLVFIPDILAGSCWNKKFISFQKSDLLKLKRRIVQNRDVLFHKYIDFVTAEQSPALFLRLHHIRS